MRQLKTYSDNRIYWWKNDKRTFGKHRLCIIDIVLIEVGVSMTIKKAKKGRVEPSAALCGALQDVLDLLVIMDSTQYQENKMHGFPSSIGAHTRHCIDHVDALLLGLDEGQVRYDRRERGTQIEQERDFAILTIEDRQAQIVEMPADMFQCDVEVAALVTSDSEEQIFSSSGERETLYVFHHTVHHLALMVAQAAQMHIKVDKTIGRAPATIAADIDHKCAR